MKNRNSRQHILYYIKGYDKECIHITVDGYYDSKNCIYFIPILPFF